MQAITSNRLRGLWLALAGVAPLLAVAGPPVVGEQAPALVVPTFSGATVDLEALRGKVVVLNFWASWCEPCRREMPLLESLSQEYRSRLAVLGLSADDRHDRKEAASAAQSVSYQTGLLADARSNGFGSPAVLPLTYVIGASGRISAVLRASQGALTEAQLRTAIETTLRGDAPR